MQTRCPACHTLYRIDADILKRAGGQARCFRCDTVFDALSNPPEAAEPDDTPADGDEPSSELAALRDLPELPDSEAIEDLQPAATAAMNAAAPDHDTAGHVDLRGAPPFEVPDDLPDIEPSPEPALSAEQALATAPPRHSTRGLLAGLLGALLIALALGQLAWFNRAQVLATPLGHNAAEGLCALAGCKVPPRRAPSRFAVLDRNIGPDPDQPGALVMRLGFSNNGEFAQPLPDIQLSFYDSQQKLMARRRLHPDEYLFPAPPADVLVEPGEAVQVDLRLEDPGRHATGFKLEFL